MRQLRRDRQFTIFILVCSFFFTACGGFTAGVGKIEKELKPDEVESLLLALKTKNHDLGTCKGVGRLTLYRDGRKNLSSRLAWIAAAPDRIRAVLSSVSGQPLFSFASDGQWFYFFDHSQQQFHKQHENRNIMKTTFSVSVEFDDIISILFGNIPVHQYRSAALLSNKYSQQKTPTSLQQPLTPAQPEASTAAEDEYTLVLKRSWGNVREKIFFYGSNKDIRKIEVFSLTGELAYRAELRKMQNVDGYRVPAVVVFSNGEGSGFRLEIERYWPQVHVSPSMFVLPAKP